MTDAGMGTAAALGSAASWAGGSILYKRLGAKVDAAGMNAAKSLVSLGFLFGALLLTGARVPSARAALPLAASGLLGIALGDTFFFLSLRELDAHLLVILCALGQAVTVLLAVAALGERPSPGAWLGMALVVAGGAAVLSPGSSRRAAVWTARGLAHGGLAILCISSAVVLAKPALASVSALQATVVRMLSAAVALTLWAAWSGGVRGKLAPFKDPALARDLLAAVAVSSLGGFWLSHVALKHLDASVANTLNSTEPLFVLPLAALFLGERVGAKAIAGAVVSVCGIGLLSSGLR